MFCVDLAISYLHLHPVLTWNTRLFYRLGSVRPPKRCRSDMDNTSTSDIVIINGNSHPDLANMVAERMGVKNGGCSVFHKSNRETIVEISDSVRGKDIYIIQTGTK